MSTPAGGRDCVEALVSDPPSPGGWLVDGRGRLITKIGRIGHGQKPAANSFVKQAARHRLPGGCGSRVALSFTSCIPIINPQASTLPTKE